MRNQDYREVSASIASRNLGDCDTFELDVRHVLAVGDRPVDPAVLDRLTGGTADRFGWPDVLIAIPAEDIREMGYVSEEDASDRVDEAREEATRETRADLLESIADDLADLRDRVERGDIEDIVSSTDLLLYGPAVAVARAALGALLERMDSNRSSRY